MSALESLINKSNNIFMKFYITTEGNQKLKRSFLNLKLFSIIYVPEILDEYGYTYDTIDEYGSFIVSNKINDLIKTYSKSKRIRGIIYSHSLISKDILPNIFDSIKNIESITDVILLDDYNLPKHKNLYSEFDEIIFFPSIKKIRLIECQALPK